jgi:hypothetical protein
MICLIQTQHAPLYWELNEFPISHQSHLEGLNNECQGADIHLVGLQLQSLD